MDMRYLHSQSTSPADQFGATDSASEERVTLSNRAFEDAGRAALDVPDMPSERVEALRGQIKNGDLIPDPERIAKALLGQGVIGF